MKRKGTLSKKVFTHLWAILGKQENTIQLEIELQKNGSYGKQYPTIIIQPQTEETKLEFCKEKN